MITNELRDYYGYHFISSIEDKEVYLNDNSIDFGFVYDSYINEEDYNSLPQYKQQDILYEAAIINDEDYTEVNTLEYKSDSDLSLLNSIGYELELSDDYITITLMEAKLLSF